jgi:biopolymer transport protein ExbD
MRRERFEKMNVVPFIDIVLVLLVIVLATASFVTNHAIKVDLPKASTQKQEDKKSITITINKEGNYFLNKESVSLDTLKYSLIKLDPQFDIISLHTDKETPFHYFVDVIDFLKERGFANVSIVTKQ